MASWKFAHIFVVAGLALGAIAAPGCSGSEGSENGTSGTGDPLDPRTYKLGELLNVCDPNDRNAQCAELADDAVPVDEEDKLGIVSADDDPTTETDDEEPAVEERRKKANGHGPVLEKRRARRGKKIIVEMKLKPGSRLAEKLVPGKVLVRTRKDKKPMARRIINVQQNGDTYRVSSKMVSMREAFRAARFSGKTKVRSADIRPEDGTPGAPKTQSLHLLGPSGVNRGWDCGLAIPVNAGKVTGEIGLRDCFVDIDLDVDFVDQWGGIWPNSGDYLEVKATGSIAAGATAYIELAAAFNASAEKKILGVDIPTPIPGLGVAVELWGGYDIDVNAKLTATTGFDYSDTVTAGVGFEVGRGFYDIWQNPPSKFTKREPTFNFIGSLNGSVYVEPRVGLSALGLAEATVALRTAAELEVTSTATGSLTASPVKASICYDLKASLQPGVTAGLTGIAEDVADLFKLDSEASYYWPGVTTTLLNDCILSEQAPASNCDATSECFTNSGCAPSNACIAPTCEAPTGGTKCSCKSHRIADCCTTADECSAWWMGNDPLPALKHWECTANRCVAALGGTGVIKQGTSLSLQLGECNDNLDCNDELPLTNDVCEAPDANHVLPWCSHLRNVVASPSTPKGFPLDVAATSADSCTNDSCLDADPATVNTCSRVSGCITSQPLVGFCGPLASCSDGNAATLDTCESGVCKHTTIVAQAIPQPGGLAPKFGPLK